MVRVCSFLDLMQWWLDMHGGDGDPVDDENSEKEKKGNSRLKL